MAAGFPAETSCSERGVPSSTTRTRLDETADLQEHWVFRAIAACDPRAALSRFRKARSEAGQRQGVDNRHLVILRDAWGRGAKTREEVEMFTAAGGRTIRLPEADARTFRALQKMLDNGGRELHEWLIDRRPASRSDLLSAVLPESRPRSRRPTNWPARRGARSRTSPGSNERSSTWRGRPSGSAGWRRRCACPTTRPARCGWKR